MNFDPIQETGPKVGGGCSFTRLHVVVGGSSFVSIEFRTTKSGNGSIALFKCLNGSIIYIAKHHYFTSSGQNRSQQIGNIKSQVIGLTNFVFLYTYLSQLISTHLHWTTNPVSTLHPSSLVSLQTRVWSRMCACISHLFCKTRVPREISCS